MIVVILAVAVLALGVALAVALGRLTATAVPEPATAAAYRPLPDGEVVADDIDGVRFDQTLRGYRMDQVDATLARLGEALAERDAELASLRTAHLTPATQTVDEQWGE